MLGMSGDGHRTATRPIGRVDSILMVRQDESCTIMVVAVGEKLKDIAVGKSVSGMPEDAHRMATQPIGRYDKILLARQYE